MVDALNGRIPRRVAAAALLLGAAILAACSVGAVPPKDTGKPVPDVPAGGVLLQGAGATFPAVLYDEWFQRFHSAHPAIVISYDAVGSGEGVRRFIAHAASLDERVDFGASDAAMRDDEMALVPGGVILL